MYNDELHDYSLSDMRLIMCVGYERHKSEVTNTSKILVEDLKEADCLEIYA